MRIAASSHDANHRPPPRIRRAAPTHRRTHRWLLPTPSCRSGVIYSIAMSDVTRILSAIEHGDPQAAAQLLPLIYNELRKLAAQRLSREKPGQTLQATALVHEAYLRLVGSSDQRWDSRGHFFAAAAEAMRRILVESARHKASQKAGGDWQRVEISDVEIAAPSPGVDVLALSDALAMLEARDPRKAALVKLRYFAGLTNHQAATLLGISSTTADNDWAYAKSWLKIQLSPDAATSANRSDPEKSSEIV